MPDHGGSLAKARALFPHAPEPWIDLSTGINPHSYPLPGIPATAWTRLPEPSDLRRLAETAASAYGAPGAANVVCAPGTQILLPFAMGLAPPGVARVLSPTYAEHARAAALAGHRVEDVERFEALAGADLAVVVNPNNPDGRLFSAERLLELAAALRMRGGLLVVDEAFMDVAPPEHGMGGAVGKAGNLVVLRSFGKFFGLAGARLGFAVASEPLARRLEAQLGPWAVSGPALAAGIAALQDRAWREGMRARLDAEAAALDRALGAHGLTPAGGTSLFRFVRTPEAKAVFEACGRHGMYLRRFDAMPDALRIGLPPDAQALARLDAALRSLPEAAA